VRTSSARNDQTKRSPGIFAEAQGHQLNYFCYSIAAGVCSDQVSRPSVSGDGLHSQSLRIASMNGNMEPEFTLPRKLKGRRRLSFAARALVSVWPYRRTQASNDSPISDRTLPVPLVCARVALGPSNLRIWNEPGVDGPPGLRRRHAHRNGHLGQSMAHLRTDVANELIKKIQQEFPDIDEHRAHRFVRIFAEHMTETGKRVRKGRRPHSSDHFGRHSEADKKPKAALSRPWMNNGAGSACACPAPWSRLVPMV
jgi:hypothetical protein